MNIWNILEIEKTQDKEKIQAAYRAKLLKTHPEDDPQGFMELRSALEEALRQADAPQEILNEDQEDWGEDDIGQWMKKVDHLYNNFSKRIDPNEWKALLQEDVCINLDSRHEIRNMLLEYMMEHFFFPQKVMCVLDSEFGLMENVDELKEILPEPFVEYIIVQGIQNEEYPPYEFLHGPESANYDDYLKMSSALTKSISAGDVDASMELIEAMKGTGIESPYLQIEYARVLCQKEQYEEAKLEMEELLEDFEDVKDVQLMYADTCAYLDDYVTAKSLYQNVYDREPDDEWARCGMARCLMQEGHYKEANEMFSALLEENPYDFDTEEWLRKCNELYIAELKEKVRESDNQDSIMDLAWSYYQNNQYEEAILLLERFDADEAHKIEQKSILGRCCLSVDRSEDALRYLKEWKSILENLPDNELNNEKRKKQLPFCFLLQSRACSNLQNMPDALAYADEAVRLDPKDVESFVHYGMLLSKQWRFDEAVEKFTKAIELNPEHHVAYVMRARAFYYMGYYGDSFEDCDKTLEIFPYELAAYVFKIKVLIEVGELDAADEILEYLKGEGLEGSELDFLNGFVLEARGEHQKAKAIYEKIVDQYNAQKESKNIFNVSSLAEVYHHLATLQYQEKRATYNSVLKLIDLGIAEEPEYVLLPEMKAEIKHERGQFKEALDLYEQIAEKAPGKIGIYGAMDALYREMDDWDRALECAQKQLEQAASGYSYMRRGQIYAYLNRTDEAKADFQKAITLAPELPYSYNYMGVLAECEDHEDEALEYYMKAIEVGVQEDEACEEAYHHAADLLCRKREFERAREILLKGFHVAGDNKFLLEIVYTLRREGQFEAAKEILERYRKKEGLKVTSPEYMLHLGHILRDEGELKEAFDCYSLSGLDDAQACLEAGKNLFFRGKFKKALKYFKESFDVFEDEEYEEGLYYILGEHYLWAARAAVLVKKQSLAEEFARKGLTYIPQNYEQYDSAVPMMEKILGGLYAILGDYEQAEHYLKSALNRRKCDYCQHGACIDALFEMAYLYWICGEKDKLKECLEKAMEIEPLDADIRGLQELIL